MLSSPVNFSWLHDLVVDTADVFPDELPETCVFSLQAYSMKNFQSTDSCYHFILSCRTIGRMNPQKDSRVEIFVLELYKKYILLTKYSERRPQ